MLRITPPPRSHATAGAHVAMRVSKISKVTFAVSLGGHVVSQTTLLLGGGAHTLTWRPPRAGAWTVTLSAVDLAGQPGNGERAGDDPRRAPAPPRETRLTRAYNRGVPRGSHAAGPPPRGAA